MLTNWMQTYIGKKFEFGVPEPEIRIEDIAHSLSLICRFGGHVKKHYSVAEHCINVALLLESWGCNDTTIAWGLLHDAAEAYIGDVVTPIKLGLPDLMHAEKFIENRIAGIFIDGRQVEGKFVKHADKVLLVTEATLFFKTPPVDNWIAQYNVKPLDSLPYLASSHQDAEETYLRMFEQYTAEIENEEKQSGALA